MGFSSTRIDQSYEWLLLPDVWDAGWKAARAAVGSSPAYVAVIGDSNAQGFATTNHMTKSFAYLLRNALVAKYGSYGDYYPASHSARFQTSIGGAAPTGTMPWTFDTTWGSSGYGNLMNGFGITMFQDNTTFPPAWVNAGSGMFVTPYACTDFDIIWHDMSTNLATWKYNIDNSAGTSLVTVTSDGRNSIRRTSLTGQTNATHTIRFGASSAAFVWGVNGVACYDPTNAKTKGIGFTNASATGMQAFHWMCSPNTAPADRIQQWQGRSKTATSTEVLTGFGFPTQPHLAIIELGINDCQNSVGLVQFRAGLRRLVEALRRGRDNCSILFLICPNPSINSSDSTSQFTRAESWSLYADHIYGVAAEYQCAVYNTHSDWVPTSVTNGWTTSSDPHPTDAGHQHIADVLTTVIV